MSFWTSGSGAPITGNLKDAKVPDFTVIPDGTMALAKIESFEFANKPATKYKGPETIYEIKWKITAGDFVNREVTQKIKPFDGKPFQIDRALNMMKLIMNLCHYTNHSNEAPDTESLKPMVGKILGIKISEYSIPKKDEPGNIEGNHVTEVHPAADFKCETGVKKEVVHSRSNVESAFSRNAPEIGGALDDLPF
ncbi:hypothetical protein [Thiocapsa sp. N5-Cardenillas]|uniref:hypothetical protein n=1 Tax=Thiocapsa sp. N5-Cardenillas TaxID=3137397 RepID=UPI0035AFC16A